jgi:opacity protein-like surface antigen
MMSAVGKGLALAFLVVALGAGRAGAQLREESSGGAHFLVGGGATLGLGDFGDAFNHGPHGLAGVMFQPAGFPVGFRVDGMYHRISGDEEVLELGDLNTRILSGTLNLVFPFTSAESALRPYILGGGGYYNTKAVGDDVPEGIGSESHFGFNAGAGFDYQLGDNFGVFLEGRFHQILTEEEDIPGSSNTNVLPISLGIRIGRS